MPVAYATGTATESKTRTLLKTPIQELAEEAFRDLLKKHRRPTTLKETLQESARSMPVNDHQPERRKRTR